jgi:hypothetical protein
MLQDPVLSGPEVDDPKGSLRVFATRVEGLLGEASAGGGFVEVKTRLFEAIETPAVKTVDSVLSHT